MDFSDGNNYTGDWVDGITADQGAHIFLSGDRYQSSNSHMTTNEQLSEKLEDDKLHGKGKMDSPDGDNYTDYWAGDTSAGESTIIFNNGNRFERTHS
ncbi:unnamed protein product [Rotaria socialis]|nr:unnamed protein product [Rotaria socialis]CAF4704809.1 unnamed protein product [Rotaria socialis]